MIGIAGHAFLEAEGIGKSLHGFVRGNCLPQGGGKGAPIRRPVRRLLMFRGGRSGVPDGQSRRRFPPRRARWFRPVDRCGHLGRSRDEFPAAQFVVSEIRTDEGAAHSWAVSGGKPPPFRRDTQPKFQAGARGGETTPAGNPNKPPALSGRPDEDGKPSRLPVKSNSDCATMKACSVSSLIMPQPPKQTHPPFGLASVAGAGRVAMPSAGRPRASPTAVPSSNPAKRDSIVEG